MQEKDIAENTEELSKEELGRLVASRWTGETTEQQTEEVDGVKHNHHESHEETSEDTHSEEYDGYASETDDDSQRFDNDDMEDPVDEDFAEEDHYDSSTSYKSDTEDGSDFSGLSLFHSPLICSLCSVLQLNLVSYLKFLYTFTLLFVIQSDITSTSNPSWLEKIQQTVRNILNAVKLFQTPVDKSGRMHNFFGFG